MAEIKVSVGIDNNFKNLIRNISDKRDIKKVFNKGIKNVALFLERESTKKTPVDTGVLRANQRNLISNSLTAKIQNKTGYGLFVHEGTKFQRSQPWMRETVEENKTEINEIFNRGVEKYFKNLTKI